MKGRENPSKMACHAQFLDPADTKCLEGISSQNQIKTGHFKHARIPNPVSSHQKEMSSEGH